MADSVTDAAHQEDSTVLTNADKKLPSAASGALSALGGGIAKNKMGLNSKWRKLNPKLNESEAFEKK